MQTILGSGGAIGVDLARELTAYTKDIRLVSRNPQKVNPDDQLFAADLSDPSSVDKAIQGSDIVYLTIGFEYKLSVWKQKWPPLINDVIDACKRYNAKLVFFDNVYMYDPDYIGNMTEETPVKPSSEKGKIRAAIADKIMKETKSGLTALIARSADFYGPSIKNSVMNELVYKNLKKR
ncbi:MAG: NAD(P)H-binding protein [Sporocytophaga sp.]|nr:NAD(P)H-binding protein [Sporocytophaga sp.]